MTLTFTPIETITIGVVLFVFGFMLGIITRPFLFAKDHHTFNLKPIIGVILLLLLAVTTVAEILLPTYKTSFFLYPLVGIVVGGYYGNAPVQSIAQIFSNISHSNHSTITKKEEEIDQNQNQKPLNS